MPSHVFVTTTEGRRVPMPQSEVTAPGSALLYVEPSKVYRVPYTGYVRRRVLASDLVLCTSTGTKVENPDDANAPDEMEMNSDGSIVAAAPRARMARPSIDPLAKKGD